MIKILLNVRHSGPLIKGSIAFQAEASMTKSLEIPELDIYFKCIFRNTEQGVQ